MHLPRMIVLERPPIIAVQGMEQMPLAIRAAESMDMAELIGRAGARWARVDALPFLTQTEAGRRFLAASPPRALARGMPPEFCPAVALAEGPAGAGRGSVVRRALESCLARLGAAREGCGCRVIALDDALTVPREEAAYAIGVSARLQVPDLGLDLMLVAEDGPGDAPEVLLRDLRGPVARLVRGPGEAVVVELAGSGRRFEGFRIPVGFRRGRLAERVYATDAEGHRLRLLVGFEPAELSGHAAAWLAWPGEG
ncbi:MAG TPA: hypothetical protein VMM59_02585 [Thermohalobaculum sp.]|nr:hypothetical protein [Thermohalobaculum sp.]